MRRDRTRATDSRGTTRRRALCAGATALAAGLAGCLYAGSPDDCDPEHPPPDGFELRNLDSSTHTVLIEIIQDWYVTASTVFEETYELGPRYEEGSVRVSGPVRFAGRYVIRATLEGEPETKAEFLWNLTPDRCDPVLIEIDNGRIGFDDPTAIQF